MIRRALAPLALATAAALCLAMPAAALAAPRQLSVQKSGAGSALITSSPTGIGCGNECQAPFPEGATVTLRAVPGANTEAIRWSGCDAVNGAGECEVRMTSARTVTASAEPLHLPLSVTKTGPGAQTSIVTSSPAAISCGASCQASLAYGASVTLSATSSPFSVKAVLWTGCDAIATGDKCVVAMSQAKAITASFEAQPGAMIYPLSVERTGSGAGTVSGSPGQILCGTVCGAELIEGTSATLSAAPAPGSVFAHWAGGGCKGAGACTTTIKAATTIKATFTLAGQRTLAVTKAGSGQGTVTARAAGIECGSACAAQVKAGAKITLTAKPAKGSSFAHWSGACQGTAKTCKLVMSEARSLSAAFSAPPAAATAPPFAPAPKPLRCKKHFKKRRVHGKARCVHVRHHRHRAPGRRG